METPSNVGEVVSVRGIALTPTQGLARAMQRAEKNIGDLLEDLSRTRQSSRVDVSSNA